MYGLNEDLSSDPVGVRRDQRQPPSSMGATVRAGMAKAVSENREQYGGAGPGKKYAAEMGRRWGASIDSVRDHEQAHPVRRCIHSDFIE
jgi:hypothetical protein